jgi:hypothetical protein
MSCTWATRDHCSKLLECIFTSLHFDLDSSIGSVSRVSTESQLLCRFETKIAEANALHATTNDEMKTLQNNEEFGMRNEKLSATAMPNDFNS